MSAPEDKAPSGDRLRRKVVVKNRLGLHLRPASRLVKLANQFPDCDVSVAKDGQSVNAKSIMGVIMLAAEHGAELEFEVGGASAERAIAELVQLVESGFGEE